MNGEVSLSDEHTAIFDAYNGVERRYTPIFAHPGAAAGASRGAAVIAAAYTALGGLFPSRQAALDASYAVSLAAIPMAEADGNPDTTPDADWLPLVNTPSHPEYPAGHPVEPLPRFSSVTLATDRLSH